MAEQRVKVAITRAFKAVMSRGDDVPLDPSEVALVQQAAEEGAIVRVKQGIINPSFLVSIVEDKERRRAWIDDTKYNDERSQKRREAGMLPLADILGEVPLQLGPGK